MEKKVPVGITARHVRLSQDHIDFLFGEDYELTDSKELSQPGTFSCEETVDIENENGEVIKNVRVVGPAKPQTIVIISNSDAIKYGFTAPVRDLDNLDGSGECYINGPMGRIHIACGVIVQQRHIHFSPSEAKDFGVVDGETVMVKVTGDKGGIMDNVKCWVKDNAELDFHIDVDDADAFMLKDGDLVEIIKK